MPDDLLGYLLSALEPHEMRRIEDLLRSDPLLEFELEQLRRSVNPIDRAIADLPIIQTPSDLVAKTMAMLPPMPEDAAVPKVDLQGLIIAPASDGQRSFRFVWSDLLAVSLASAALLALLIPSIARGRYEARKTACQEHLRQLGTAITQFVLLDRHESLPQIAESGPEAFAGMYYVRLGESGLVNDGQLRWCPEVEVVSTERPVGGYVAEAAVDPAPQPLIEQVVRLEDLRNAHQSGKVDKLKWLQRTAGGDYAYNLGVVDGDHYEAPHYEARASFAVLGDAPISGVESTDGVDIQKLKWGHGDSGANLLFEDGSVRFIDMTSSSQIPDHPFLNHRGSIEAGVNVDDASLAPSWRPPFISARQR